MGNVQADGSPTTEVREMSEITGADLRHPRTCREGGGCGEREQSCCTPSSRFFPAFRREPLHKRGGPSTLGSSPRAALKLLSFAVTQAARLSRSRHPGPGSPRWSANTRSARREDAAARRPRGLPRPQSPPFPTQGRLPRAPSPSQARSGTVRSGPKAAANPPGRPGDAARSRVVS